MGDICEFRYGKALPEKLRRSGPHPVYGSNGPVGCHDAAITEGQTIVVGRKGSIGEVSYSPVACWPIDTTYYIDRSCTDQDITWLTHMLRSLHLTQLNKSAAVPGLNREDAYRQRLLLPSLSDQRRIAAILAQAGALRAKRQAVMARLDEVARALFLERFGDPSINPKGWRRTRITDIATVVTGNTPPRTRAAYYGASIEWLKSDNLSTGTYYATGAEEHLSPAGRTVGRTAPPQSILVTCIAGSPASIGNAAMLDREAAFNQQINALVPKVGNPHFLYAQLRVGKALVQEVSTGAMKGMVSKSRFEGISLIFPPIEQQDAFARVALAIEAQRRVARRAAQETDALFASLQHRAFRGEL